MAKVLLECPRSFGNARQETEGFYHNRIVTCSLIEGPFLALCVA
jgi:hypothetical protein